MNPRNLRKFLVNGTQQSMKMLPMVIHKCEIVHVDLNVQKNHDYLNDAGRNVSIAILVQKTRNTWRSGPADNTVFDTISLSIGSSM